MGRFDGVGLLYFSPERKLIEFKETVEIDKRGDVYTAVLADPRRALRAADGTAYRAGCASSGDTLAAMGR